VGNCVSSDVVVGFNEMVGVEVVGNASVGYSVGTLSVGYGVTRTSKSMIEGTG